MPTIQNAALRETSNKVNAIIRGLKAAGIDTDKMSPIIAYLVVIKLPDRPRSDWENSQLDYTTYPSFSALNTFLQNRCFVIESMNTEPKAKKVEPSKQTSSNNKVFDQKLLLKNVNATVAKSKSAPSCPFCQQDHYASNCDIFFRKSQPDRYALVKEHKLCTNCLRPHVTPCRSSSCRKCGERHHTLLHRDDRPRNSSSNFSNSNGENQSNSRGESSSNETNKNENTKTSLNLAACSNCIILLPSAIVNVIIDRKIVPARVLLDNCSQANLVTDDFVNKHGLVRRYTHTSLESIAPGNHISSSSTKLRLQSRFNDFAIDMDADIVPRIPYRVTQRLTQCLPNLGAFPFAECDISNNGAVKILVGAEFASRILLGTKKFHGELCLEESRFGWVAQGPLQSETHNHGACCHFIARSQDLLSQF